MAGRESHGRWGSSDYCSLLSGYFIGFVADQPFASGLDAAASVCTFRIGISTTA